MLLLHTLLIDIPFQKLDGVQATFGATLQRIKAAAIQLMDFGAVLHALDRGTSVLPVSRSYGLDPETVRC